MVIFHVSGQNFQDDCTVELQIFYALHVYFLSFQGEMTPNSWDCTRSFPPAIHRKGKYVTLKATKISIEERVLQT